MDVFDFLGIEARGFIFGPPIALAIGAKFVPLRKPRKLPGISHHPAGCSKNAYPFNTVYGIIRQA